MISAEDTREKIIQASEDVGVNDYIVKPFKSEDLIHKIKNIMEMRANPPELNPGRSRVLMLLGEAHREKGETEKAEHYFGQAMASNPDYLKVYVSMADLYLKDGRDDQAVSVLEKAAFISPLNTNRHAAIGEIVRGP